MIGVGMRGLSGMEDTRLLAILETAEEISEELGSHIPLSTAPIILDEP